MDTKLELLNVKQENKEMTVDSLFAYLNECMKQMHQKNMAKGKRIVARTRKEYF